MFGLSVLTYLLLAHSGAAQNDFFGKTKQEIIDFGKQLSENILTIFSKSSTDSMKFFLYQKGSEIPVVVTENNATKQLDLSRVTIFIIHGWTSNGTLSWIIEIAKRVHNVGEFNVIAVDWSVLAAGDYFSAVKNIKVVGSRIKTFIKTVNITVDTVHIIGHSLGAQVVPHIANALGTEKFNRVDGLDPAGPLFDWPIVLPPMYRLTADSGKFVQVIHTSVFVTGVTVPSGTIDFYVNKGANQPGCPVNNIIPCSHQISHTYYILTINNTTKYPATKWCPLSRFGCKSDTFMGFGVDITKSGVYNVTAAATGIDSLTQF